MTLPLGIKPDFALLIAAFLGADTATQIAFKAASITIGDVPIGWRFLTLAAGAPEVWLAVALYVVTYALWMLVLQRSLLSRAFPLTALSYVTVPLAAWMIFGETIGTRPMIGIVLILAGVSLIGQEAGDAQIPDAIPVGRLPCAD